ncbi:MULTISPECIES: hypothetical protein [Ramlibacter]|uniref:DUF2946 domain-containing protein n=1 Tax=Ramlibacter aquaticus TaxID=2780094 RepID=A0ABR9SFV2_9BURK|nr:MULTISPECIES: hypothetical protein [Ramlibacter]MBE7941235.1 hypothetical protein [Ramlibacter aquaticus]
MKPIRVWLLLLLAFALPLRGAMAAGLLCAEPGVVFHAAARAGTDHSGHSHGSTGATAHQVHGEQVVPVHGHGHGHAPGHEADGKCSLCASCCTLSVPVVLSFSLPQAPPATARYPDYLTPRAEFVSGGPERPPRSL